MVPRSSRFDELILPHLDDAYTLARYLLRDEHDAQDAVQEAALRALRYFDNLMNADARPWFLAIVRNCCYTWQSKRQSERAVVSYSAVESIAVVEPRGADARTIERSERARLQAAVD